MQGRLSQIMTLCAIALLCLSFLIGGIVLTSPLTHAAIKTQQPSLSLPKLCAQTYVHLNGTQPPTVKCMVPGHLIAGRMLPITTTANHKSASILPNAYQAGCLISSIDIKSRVSGDVCFGGVGSSYVRITNVYELDGYTNNGLSAASGYVFYNNGSPFGFSGWTTYTCGNSPFCGSTTVTKEFLDLG